MNTNKPNQSAQRRSCSLGWQALLVIGVALLAGCISPEAAKHVKNFSSAVALTADNSAQAYQLVEKAYFEKQLSDATVNCLDGTNIHLDSFDPKGFKVFWQPNQIQVRLDVLNCLTTYAEHLSTLMGNPALSNLDTATTKIGEALTNLNEELVTAAFVHSNAISASEFQAFTAAINFIGHWVITRKEQKEARASIEKMQMYVPEICKVFEQDLGYVRGELDKDYKGTLESEDQFLRHNALYLDPIQRRAELDRLVEMAKDMRTADEALAGTQASVAALAAAHRSLSEAFTKDTTKINSLIGELSTEGQRVAAYYSSLQSTNN